MNSLFYFLCGCLYVIGQAFGLTYKEISIYICIYGCPIICIVCAAIAAIFADLRSFWGQLRFSVNTALFILYWWKTKTFWIHYGILPDEFGGRVSDTFQLCVDDITKIANDLNITYQECNIYIYCYLFFSIVIFHLIQPLIFREYTFIKFIKRKIAKKREQARQ